MQVSRTKLWSGRAFAVVAMSAVAALAACGGSSAPNTTSVGKTKAPVARGGGPISLVTAVDTIATERCAREGRCNRVGAGRRFISTDACKTAFAQEERKSLGTAVCESGFVEPDTLLDCLDAIRANGCAGEATAACVPSSMCSP